MANQLMASFKELLLGGGIDLSSDTIKIVLVDTGSYTFSASDKFLSDVPGGARVAISSALTTKTITAGVFDADDVLFVALTGSTVSAIYVFKDTGTPATSDLIAWFDTATSGLPFTPSGANETIQWSSGASKIFAL